MKKILFTALLVPCCTMIHSAHFFKKNHTKVGTFEKTWDPRELAKNQCKTSQSMIETYKNNTANSHDAIRNLSQTMETNKQIIDQVGPQSPEGKKLDKQNKQLSKQYRHNFSNYITSAELGKPKPLTPLDEHN
jgi:hypothetical protein